MTHSTQFGDLFENATPQEVLTWAYEQFGKKLALVSSFQITGVVTMHMLQQLGITIPVLTLDTGLLFPETHELMARLEGRFGLEIQRIQPKQTVAEQAAVYGDNLWERQPNRCCHYRKVLPLREALKPYEAWITGLRRDQSRTRANTPLVSWDEKQQMVKLAPFAHWTQQEVWDYIHEHQLPYNTLHNQNYPSIGCMPCTRPVSPDQEDFRAGRWAGQSKTECGIHVPTNTISIAAPVAGD